MLEARNSTKRIDTLLAVDDLNLQIRTAEAFGFLGAKPLESVERGMIGICPHEIILWPDLTCQENLALIGNLYEHVRSSKGTPENGIEDLLRRLALARSS